MLAHAEGRYNVLSPRRDAAGRFRKHRKRRRRPRHGKILAGTSDVAEERAELPPLTCIVTGNGPFQGVGG